MHAPGVLLCAGEEWHMDVQGNAQARCMSSLRQRPPLQQKFCWTAPTRLPCLAHWPGASLPRCRMKAILPCLRAPWESWPQC